MRNQHLLTIRNIANLLNHKGSKIDESIDHKELRSYASKLEKLAKQLNRAMLTQTDLTLILEIVKGADTNLKSAEQLPTKIRSLRNLSIMTPYERSK
tara:strand:- start:726 stop:1016 length:291 start_codon:yes stop_codon:yes gene_type:complete